MYYFKFSASTSQEWTFIEKNEDVESNCTQEEIMSEEPALSVHTQTDNAEKCSIVEELKDQAAPAEEAREAQTAASSHSGYSFS